MNKKWKAALAAFAASAVLAVGLWGLLNNSQPPTVPVGHDKFTRLVEDHPEVWFQTERDLTSFGGDLTAGRVREVAVSPAYVFAQLDGGYRYYVTLSGDNYLVAKLLESHLKDKDFRVVTTGYIGPPQTLAHALLANFNPGLLLFAILSIATVATMLVTLRQVIGDGKSFDLEKQPKTKFKDIIGVDDAKDALSDIKAYLADPKRYVSMGARPPRGVLLEGPPGTGKTMLARALAGECGASFIAVNGSDFSAKFLGVGVSRVQKLFKLARKHTPVVVFIDEADGLGVRNEGGAGGAAEQENNRTINAFLVQLDGFRPTEGVIVVAATNNSSNIDPAMKRDGRFDRTCYLTLPNVEDREQLFRLYAATKPVAADVEYRQLARLSTGLSPASIAAVVNAAAVSALKAGSEQITHNQLLAALDHKNLGAPNASVARVMTPDERRRVSIHEAGHAIVAKVLGDGVVEKVTIIPRAKALGVTHVTRAEEQYLMSETDIENRLEVLLGGRLAEQLILGTTSTGAAEDLEVASRMAFRMAGIFGFSDKIGPFSVAGLKGEPVQQIHEEVLHEARRILGEAQARAAERLRKNRAALELLTDELLEHDTVSGDVVDACLKRASSGATRARVSAG